MVETQMARAGQCTFPEIPRLETRFGDYVLIEPDHFRAERFTESI
jgi:hypothetical protein